MEKKYRYLRGRGEYDYDYVHDILFFKTKKRNYDRSVELDRFVIDIDKENFVVGIQIFDASEFLGIPKLILRNIRNWQFHATVDENKLEIRLMFRVVHRNKMVEKNPIIIEPLKESLPDSKVICSVP